MCRKYKDNKKSDTCRSLLLFAFGVDITDEPEDIYPTLVCNNCYRTMQRISSAKSSGVPFNTSLTLSSWSAHSQACQLCSQECESGGWPRKKKHTGRPLAADVTHLARQGNYEDDELDQNPSI